MKKNYFLPILLCVLFSNAGRAQVIESTLSIDIYGYDNARLIYFQPDGILIIGGSAEESSATYGPKKMAVARINANTTLDTTFGTNGVTQVYPNNSNYILADLANDNAGNLLMLGNYFSHCIVRLTPNGLIDTTFGTNGIIYYSDFGTTDTAQKLLLLPDGDILVFGFGQPAGFTKTVLILKKLNSDGSVDSAFGTNGYATVDAGFLDNAGAGCFLQNDGKIVVAGNYNFVEEGVTKKSLFLARLNLDGTLDPSYGVNGISLATDLITYFQSATMDSNNEITALSWQAQYPGPSPSHVRVKFDTNGNIIDEETLIIGTGGTGSAAAIQADGKMVFAGNYINVVEANGENCYFERHNEDGSADMGFSPTGYHYNYSFSSGNEDINTLKLGPDGKIYFAGHSRGNPDFRWRIGRLNPGSILEAEEVEVDIFTVYPNPAEDVLFISGVEIIAAHIYDLQGRLVIDQTSENKINVASLSVGTYILEVESNDGNKIIRKFVKK